LFAFLVISLAISSTLLLTSGSTSLFQTEIDSDKTETMFSLLEESNSTVIEIFRQLEGEGITIPQESYIEYNQALVLADESQILIQTHKYSEAETRIIQALDKFKESLKSAYSIIGNQTSQLPTSIEKYFQIQSSINRYTELLGRIQNLTNLVSQAGFNTTTFQERIRIITSLLTRASNDLDQKRFEAALKNIAEAKRISNNIVSKLKDIATSLKTERLDAYIANTQERLALIKRTANSLSATYPISIIENAISAIDDAETSLSNAKTYLENDQISNTLTELVNSKESEQQAINYLQPQDSLEDTSLTDSPNVIVSP
jgi:DNA-binding Lrp family transcriptional regulator